jgi:hydrophobe/amphiphile efflux-1 (HAE1) family protein
MSRFFIHRPIFATVISIVIVIAGLVSFGALPVAKFPEIAPPTVRVTAFYPGASSATIAETVATPLEQEINGVEGMLYMSSNSSNDGSYVLTVTFALGTDLDMAAVLVQNRVAVAESKLPQEVRQQGVTTRKQSTQILQFISLYSSDGSFDDLFLSNYALTIKDQLSRLEGVGEVQVFGAGDYGMRVWLDPRLLKLRGLTTEDVVAAIREQNIQVAAGQIGAAPAPPGTPFQLSVNTEGRLITPEQFGNIILRAGNDRAVLRVRDVARVELGAKDYNYRSTYNGNPSASIGIYQLPGANALTTATLVRNLLADLAAENDWPTGVDYYIPFDTTAFVEASISEVYSTLLVAVVLVVLVIYVFLQDWRATIIPVAAIPVSLIGTFAAMNAIGFSLNMLSLFGVVLAIGIVVDDAIVVVENTSRHLAAGLSPKAAAVKAMDEITGPVIATTLVLLAVFVPTAFMPGITGQLFQQFALTISAAVVISTVNALTLSPALCGIVLRAPRESSFIGFRLFNIAFDKVSAVYGALVAKMVRMVAVVMLIYVALVVFTGWSLAQLPTGFVPEEDQGYLFVNVQLPDAASQERTAEVMGRLDEVYRTIPGIAHSVTISGYSLLGGFAGSNQGMSVLVLTPWDERESEDLSLMAIRRRLGGEFSRIQEAVAFAFTPPAIDGLGAAGGFQMEVLDRAATGYDQLQSVAEGLAEAANGQSGLAAVNSTFRANVPQIFVDVDRAKVKTMGIPLGTVFGSMSAYLGSAYVNDFTFQNRSYQVRAQAEAEFRGTPEDLRRLDVRGPDGTMVPLGALIDVRNTVGPTVVRRYNLFPAAALNGSAAPRFSSGQALLLMEETANRELRPGFGFEWTGMSYQEKMASGGQTLILGLAVLFVFLVLAAQYESWTNPAAVIAVVPLAALGVVLALTLRGSDNNTYTQIGIVLLIALASKNAILIVEFASERQREGLEIADAAASAASLRFRAILMTAFSSILGFLPLLVASGAGAAGRQAVGNAVVGGMIAATIFALLFVPTFFVLFSSLGRFASRRPSPPPADLG